jgi:hypothetical protein
MKFLPLLMILFLGGCSLRYVDRGGITRQIGFLSVRTNTSYCALYTSVASVGVTMDATRETGGFNVGYRRITTASLEDDASMVLVETTEGALQVHSGQDASARDDACRSASANYKRRQSP